MHGFTHVLLDDIYFIGKRTEKQQEDIGSSAERQKGK